MNIEKIVRIGTMEVYDSKFASIYCKIEYLPKLNESNKMCLSISGVIGPTRGGNALGGCGQINMDFWHENPEHNDSRYGNLVKPKDIDFAEGWNRLKWLYFLKIWKLYHLNNMNAGCIHQRAAKWGNKDLVIFTYKLKMDIVSKQNKIKEQAEEALLKNCRAEISEAEQYLLNLSYEVKCPGEEDYASMRDSLSEHYRFDTEEKKTAGWLYPKEHPEGVLCKPCPDCSYEYGSAWKYTPVPKTAIDFLYNLPNADKEPAWC